MNEDKTIRPEAEDASTIRPEQQNDATIRSDANATVRPTNEDVTIRPDTNDATIRSDAHDAAPANDSNATIRSDNGDATIRSGEDETKDTPPAAEDATIRADLDDTIFSQPETSSTPPPVNQNDDSFNLKGVNYKKLKVISENTGEAEIYLIENEGEQSILKLYRTGILPKEAIIAKLHQLKHPNIINVFDYGYCEQAGWPQKRFYERMEYAQGGTVDKSAPIKDKKVLKDIALTLVDALHFMHQNEISHKDIKPENLFFADEAKQRVVIADFGIASLFDAEAQMGATQTKARTPEFSAPESYRTSFVKVTQADGSSKHVEKIIVGPPGDFYSLGVSLLWLWNGSTLYPGFGNDDWAMCNYKNTNDVPIPEDFPADLVNLAKGMTVRNEVKRWGYDEVMRWYKGEDVPVFEEVQAKYDKPFVFDKAKGIEVNSPHELADLLLQNPEKGKKLLYKNAIADWLKSIDEHELEADLRTITEDDWKTNMDAGLKAAVYTLDKSIPLTDINGNTLGGPTTIGKALLENAHVYKEALKDKGHDIFVYLNTRDFQSRNLVKQIYKFYDEEKSLDAAFYNTVYYLNPESPYAVMVADKSSSTKIQVHFAQEPADIVRIFATESPTQEAIEALSNGNLTLWLAYTNRSLADKIQALINEDLSTKAKQKQILYTLDGEVGLNLSYSGEEDFAYTHEEIGKLIAKRISEKDKYIFSDLQSTDSDIMCYFRARGWQSLTSEVSFYFAKKRNEGKIVPYTQGIGAFKFVSHILETDTIPFYANGKELYSIDDIKKLSGKTLHEELNHGHLKDWLAVKHQERNSLKTWDQYRGELMDYMEVLGSLNKKDEKYLRYKAASDKIVSLIKKNKRKDSAYFFWKFALPALMLAVAAYTAFLALTNPLGAVNSSLSLKFWEAPKTLYYISVVGLFVFNLIRSFRFMGALFRALFMGVPLSIALYYAGYGFMGYALPYLPYIITGVCVLVPAYFIYRGFKINSYTGKSIRANLYNKKNPVIAQEILQHTFKSNNSTFTSSKSSMYQQYANERRWVKRELWKFNGIGIAASIVLLVALMLFHPVVKTQNQLASLLPSIHMPSFNTGSGNDAKLMKGEWDGTFEGRAAHLEITSTENKAFEGNITIQYEKPVTQKISGSVRGKKVSMQDLLDISFKGDYAGELDASGKAFKGTYTLSKTKGKFPFEFSKN